MELFKGARNKEELGNIDKFIKRNIFIAAVAISAEGKLITGNKKHFGFIEGLKVDLPPYRGVIVKK